jgi:hypothetical protein
MMPTLLPAMIHRECIELDRLVDSGHRASTWTISVSFSMPPTGAPSSKPSNAHGTASIPSATGRRTISGFGFRVSDLRLLVSA